MVPFIPLIIGIISVAICYYLILEERKRTDSLLLEYDLDIQEILNNHADTIRKLASEIDELYSNQPPVTEKVQHPPKSVTRTLEG